MVSFSWTNVAPLSSPIAEACKGLSIPSPLTHNGFANRALILCPTEFGIKRTCVLPAREQAHLLLPASEAEGESQAVNRQRLATSIHGWSKSCFGTASGSWGRFPPW